MATAQEDAKSRQTEAQTRMDADKSRLAKEREERAKHHEKHTTSNKGRPTPTQEEADLIKLGHPVELEPDGSPEDPNVGFGPKKDEKAEKTPRGSSSSSHQTGGSGSITHGSAAHAKQSS